MPSWSVVVVLAPIKLKVQQQPVVVVFLPIRLKIQHGVASRIEKPGNDILKYQF